MRRACAPRSPRGSAAYAELVGNKRAAIITADDVMTSSAALLSVFIREPEFVGQTKDRLSSAEATRVVENAVRDPFDHWLAASPADATRLLEWVIERAEERLRRRQEKEIGRQNASRKLRLPGKLADCSAEQRRRHRNLHRRGRFRRRLRQAGAQPRQPGDPAAPRQNPQRRQCRPREARREPAALRPHAGARRVAARAPIARTTSATTASSS